MRDGGSAAQGKLNARAALVTMRLNLQKAKRTPGGHRGRPKRRKYDEGWGSVALKGRASARRATPKKVADR